VGPSRYGVTRRTIEDLAVGDSIVHLASDILVSSDFMKTVLFALLLLSSPHATANRLVILADISLLPESGYANMPQDPECGRPAVPLELTVICVGGWSRYRLSGVTRLNGEHLEDITALIYADPVLGGRWRLVLETLGAAASAKYGASYKAVSANPAHVIGGQQR
jgi:hypothetical protein